ncbi:hypothetical protein LWM68_00155 [Niabella sp. W65]|nr:hypothetical protein [Niabella sp. W65]MCH7361336.1 hypothetical protein [Niabella sp. W65]ULT45151.1 hypothetical protein KRR40_18730 [Niabella sp. I65]
MKTKIYIFIPLPRKPAVKLPVSLSVTMPIIFADATAAAAIKETTLANMNFE